MDIQLDESKEDVPVEEPKDSGETEEEESSDVQEEKSRDWADQVEEEESKPTMVVETSEEPVEDEFSRELWLSRQKETITAAIQGGFDLRVTLTFDTRCVLREPGQSEAILMKKGDIITGVRQSVEPNWLIGTFDGRELCVHVSDVEPLPSSEND